MYEQSLSTDPRFARLLPPPAPPYREAIQHWFFTDDVVADDAYQLVELIRAHEDEVDDMIDYLWNVGDRPAREMFATFDESREAFSKAANRNGPRRLLKALVARHPARGWVLIRKLPLVELRERGNLNYSREAKQLRKVVKRSRLPHGAGGRRRSRRRGAGRPGHRSRQRANAPPEDGDNDPDPDVLAPGTVRAFSRPRTDAPDGLRHISIVLERFAGDLNDRAGKRVSVHRSVASPRNTSAPVRRLSDSRRLESADAQRRRYLP